jgi:hypothetical protein
MSATKKEKGKQLKAGDVIYLTNRFVKVEGGTAVDNEDDMLLENDDDDALTESPMSPKSAPTTKVLQTFFHAEGCMNVDVGMLNPENLENKLELDEVFNECIFRVCPQLSYTAQASLNKLLKIESTRPMSEHMTEKEKIVNEKFHEQLDFAKRKNLREKARNELLRETSFAAESDFTFGMMCQLEHMKTGRYVTACTDLAKCDKDSFRLQLQDDGDEGSWFQLSPLFKYRVDGKPVYHNDQIVLKSVLFPDYYIQSGVETLLNDPQRRTEVNVSKIEHGYQIQCYTNSAEMNSGCLTVGQAIRLVHSEAEAVLTGSANRNPDAWKLQSNEQRAKDNPEEYMKVWLGPFLSACLLSYLFVLFLYRQRQSPQSSSPPSPPTRLPHISPIFTANLVAVIIPFNQASFAYLQLYSQPRYRHHLLASLTYLRQRQSPPTSSPLPSTLSLPPCPSFYMYMSAYTYAHAYAHTHMHIYIHICIYIYLQPLLPTPSPGM